MAKTEFIKKEIGNQTIWYLIIDIEEDVCLWKHVVDGQDLGEGLCNRKEILNWSDKLPFFVAPWPKKGNLMAAIINKNDGKFICYPFLHSYMHGNEEFELIWVDVNADLDQSR